MATATFNKLVQQLTARGVTQIILSLVPDEKTGKLRAGAARGDKGWIASDDDTVADAAIAALLPKLDEIIATEEKIAKAKADALAAAKAASEAKAKEMDDARAAAKAASEAEAKT